MNRLWQGALLLAAVCVGTSPADDRRLARRALPGTQLNGSILLPNQWSLRPTGRQIEIGDLPVNMALDPTGKWLAILHAGNSDHEVIVVDVAKQEIACRTTLDQAFYGLAFSPDGKNLYASGGEFAVVHSFRFEDGLLAGRRQIPIMPVEDRFVVGGVAVDKTGTLFAAGTWGDAVCRLKLDEPDKKTMIPVGKASFPYALLPAGERLFVSLWGAASVAVIDLARNEISAQWPTEAHPTEMALSPDGKTLYVACANSTKIAVLDAATGAAREKLSCSLFPNAPAGNTPSSLCLSPDGELLFVANSDANNVTVFNVHTPGAAVPLGFIPVGWYPTCVRFNAAGKTLFVANGKGTTPKANPQGEQPTLPRNGSIRQYIGRLFLGTLSVIELPTPKQMSRLTKTAFECSPLQRDAGVATPIPPGHPIPTKVGDPSPIKYCVYIVKENRTYDQVFGDVPEGNGDPGLCIFPERTTPNQHALAKQFVLLDNFYVDGEVSADGHEWTMGAYATDYVEKIWPLTYRGGAKSLGKLGYPAEGSGGPIAYPAGGYFWDRCAAANVTYRSYGEFIDNGPKLGDPSTTKIDALKGHYDPLFRGYDLKYPDAKRAARFLEEVRRFENDGDLPRFIVLRLPNDHTFGASPGRPTPTAMVAENDLAVGLVVEGLSKSKFWKQMAIFVLEDDAQNGPDHVDAHRSNALVVGPYCKRGFVDSAMYSTSSVLRTMGLILGTKPLSQFDAAARPMVGSFQTAADDRPFMHIAAQVSLVEKNRPDAWGAAESAKFDLTKEDQADEAALNEVIWRSVKGPKSSMPPPVRAAFFTGRAKPGID